MNGNLLFSMLEDKTAHSGLSTILQTYWYALLAVPCVLVFARMAKVRKRPSRYRW